MSHHPQEQAQAPLLSPVERAELERLLEQARAEGNPWAQMAGIFKDNPLFEQWQEAIRENRRRVDEDPQYR
jgi:cytochrome c peroxidase